MRCPHTHFPKGAHVWIRFKGEERGWEDYYVETLSKSVRFRHLGVVPVSRIQSISYFRNRDTKSSTIFT